MTRTTLSSSHAFRMGCTALAIVTLSLLTVSQALSAPATIVDSVGFELPKFNPAFSNAQTAYTGQLEGQAPFPEPLPVGTWLQTKPVGNFDSKATVVNTVAASGSQSVKVTRGNGKDARWAVPVSGWPSDRYVCISWDMRVEQTVGASGTFGPFFGVEAYDDDAASIGLLSSLGVDATTGEVLYQEQDTGFLVAPGPTVTFGAWNSYMIELDYLTHSFRAFVNGSLLATDGFVDQNNVVGGLNEFTDADISTLAAAGDAASQALPGTAYFDNFLVEQGPLPCDVPEPAALALASIGAVAAIRRGRRS